MWIVTVFFALLFYVATAILVGGLAYKIWSYFTVPVPLKIFTAPAPRTRAGATWRVVREVALFESLFKSSKWIWLFGALFHAGLFVVLLIHLRYFIEPVWTWVVVLQPFGLHAGLAMLAGLGGLWVRRLLLDRSRYISQLSDHLMIWLLGGIASLGLWVKYFAHPDIVGVKAFFLGLIYFDWQPLPADVLMLVHLALVAILMIVLPFSKLLHIPGIFFSPSRNQWDDARERRHIADWNAAYDATRKSGV